MAETFTEIEVMTVLRMLQDQPDVLSSLIPKLGKDPVTESLSRNPIVIHDLFAQLADEGYIKRGLGWHYSITPKGKERLKGYWEREIV